MDRSKGGKAHLYVFVKIFHNVKHMFRDPNPNLGHRTSQDIGELNKISYEEYFILPPHLLTHLISL